MDTASKIKSARNNHYCCISGCRSRTGRDDFIFYRIVRRKNAITERWLEAIGRKHPDGSAWKPSKNSRVCGKHFRNGKPSKNPDDPNYVPNLFMPEIEPTPTEIERKRTISQEAEHSVVS